MLVVPIASIPIDSVSESKNDCGSTIFIIATSTLVAIASDVSADEFPVKIPRYFETEVFVEEQFGERFDPIQFQISDIHFSDFANYRIRSFDATTIRPGLVEKGLNIVCGESEKIVVGGQCLSLTRQSQEFQGSISDESQRLGIND